MKPFFCGACLGLTGAVVQAQSVQWNIEKRHAPHQRNRRAAITAEAHEETITNERDYGGYFASVRIGTPGKNITLQLDTGSSDLWVPSSDASICDTDNEGCPLGSFDPDDSDTYDDVGPGMFYITYADNSYAKGDYFQDRFDIGGTVISNLTMGLGKKTSISNGIIGIGYAANEASIDTVNTAYPNLPIAMYQSGKINTVAYSLWLNDLDASTGNILFGAIDTEKYVGSLMRVAMVPEDGEDSYSYLSVSMTSLVASSSSGTDTLTSSSFPMTVVLDSGTTLTYLPQDLTLQIWKEVGAVWDTRSGMPILPCSYGSHDGYFSFGFAGSQGPRINVTMDELVMDIMDVNDPVFNSGDWEGERVCAFGILNQTYSPYVLGDTFLRSAYVVYDMVNNEVGLASTKFNSTKTHIVSFESKGAHIPLATAVPSQSVMINKSEGTEHNYTAANGFQDIDGDDGNGDDDGDEDDGNDDDDDDDNAASTTRVAPAFAIAGTTMMMLLLF